MDVTTLPDPDSEENRYWFDKTNEVSVFLLINVSHLQMDTQKRVKQEVKVDELQPINDGKRSDRSGI
jgi:hypothetical protein